MRAAKEADLLGGRAVGVAHEGREVRHLLGGERPGLRAAHRAEAHGALAASLQQLRDARLRAGAGAPAALGDRRWRQAGVAQVAEGRGAQPKIVGACWAMAGVLRTWKMRWLESWPWVMVSSAGR
jgi:hypothetical protein